MEEEEGRVILQDLSLPAGFIAKIEESKTEVRVINKSEYKLPDYQTPQSAGMDLRANIKTPKKLGPMERDLVPTGIHIQLPKGYEAQIRPRSGMALKYGITVLNSPGTIDADFRGDIGIILVNLSHEDFIINPGDRVAQMVVARYEQVRWSEEDLMETKRGSGGFGSTDEKLPGVFQDVNIDCLFIFGGEEYLKISKEEAFNSETGQAAIFEETSKVIKVS